MTTNADAVNGDVSSPDALRADPGPDGISLREAITAADNGGGQQTITFSPSLDGETISPQDSYNVTQPGIAVVGTLDGQGQPTVTLDAVNVSYVIFAVGASAFTLSGLRMTDIGAGGYGAGIALTAGDAFTPSFVHDLTIENNVFDNTSAPPTTRANAIYLSMQSTATSAEISNVSITGNSFAGFGNGGDDILAAAGGTDGLLRNVGIEGNHFSSSDYPVEFGDSDNNGRVEGARIVRNTFTGSQQAVDLNFIGNNGSPATTGNVIDGTLIAQNVFRDGNRGPDVVLLGGMTNATGNSITNTTIQDNVMTGDTTFGGVSVVGGRAGSSNNLIDGVKVVNDAIEQDMGGVSVNANLDGGSGNAVSGVTVVNSIVAGNSLDFDHVASSQVSYSLSDQSGYAGTNGNISGDPLFVHSAGGDFHLQAGSPAIDAGTSSGAPSTDLECRVRVDDPGTANTGGGASPYYDMGAFEFGSPATNCLNTGIASGPSAFTQSASATFAFSSDIQSATFECSLDGAAFAACTNPQAYSDLSEGPHTFDVRAVDSDGIQDPAPATYSWVVDATPPTTSIDTSPSSLSNSSAATFVFSANEASTFECSLDSGAFTDCTSPVSYSGLSDGPHAFAVQATDRAGNTSTAASYGWTIDTTPPTLDSVSVGPSTIPEGETTTITASASSDAVAAEFYVDNDAGPGTNTPMSGGSGSFSMISYGSSVSPGTHTIGVRVRDTAGNWSPPQTTTLTVVAPVTLTASHAGSGFGRVTSSPAGIDCTVTCSTSFPYGTQVTLTATPDAGSDFTGWWGGGCSGTDTCQVTMSVDATVTATFVSTHTLTVQKSGSGDGTVTSDVGRIDCGPTCVGVVDEGTQVTLTAKPALGSAFSGWSGGGCSGTGTCQEPMNEDTTVTANFVLTHTLRVQKSGSGSGVVNSDVAGIDCGATCIAVVDEGTQMTLTATPAPGSAFIGWSGGGCSGTHACQITVGADAMVTATFVLTHKLTVQQSGAGSGTVTSDVGGIDCGATCAGVVDEGTQVTLTAVPDAGSSFIGWSGGGCSGTGTCQVTVGADSTVMATFAQIPCVVPSVKGKALAAAKRAIVAAHCALGKIRHAASKKVAKHKVISQSPAPGRRLTNGSKVNVVLSTGKTR